MLVSWLSCCGRTSADVVLIGRNISLSFTSVDANFAPSVKASGERGMLYVAEPVDACSRLTNKAQQKSNHSSMFVLVVRGGCSFEDKVRIGQEAGFKAVIVYNNEMDGPLVAMSGSSVGINIHAVFVSRASGELLKKYAGSTDAELWILPSNENSAWSIMAISFISLLAMSAVLATCFFLRRHRIRQERPQTTQVRDFHGMSRRLVKAMPSLVFTSIVEDNCTSQTCAICIEDYNVGDKLRILPCRHKFHAACVDAWLTSWRTFCPMCKRDARTATGEPPASESTPLLSSSPQSVASSSVLSSYARSSTASSPAIQITRASLPHSASHASSLASTYAQQSLHSDRQSPSLMSVSRSSVDLRNALSQRSRGSSRLASPLSVALAYPSISPMNSRYMSYVASPSSASMSYLGHGHRQNTLHHTDSTVSFSPFASAHSLPEC
ncbi:hypothetical protein MLD38_033694 [Melastoma candidum]|uniref:Uncharacterized protein n=1 Tax=Melastoma candidum TaxID=119954 RepID=A0ACB9M7D7_9MYRT|nr:hypothetical protein MLD38_033694 [Melastoma candidum]